MIAYAETAPVSARATRTITISIMAGPKGSRYYALLTIKGLAASKVTYAQHPSDYGERTPNARMLPGPGAEGMYDGPGILGYEHVHITDRRRGHAHIA
jgi:hypothetical protein